MTLDPVLRDVIDGIEPPPSDVPFAQARKLIDEAADDLTRRVAEPGPAVHRIDDHTIPVPGGKVRVRVYTPPGPGPFPAHMFIHAGSWCQGSVDSVAADITCRERCHHVGVVVVSADYRLAPEHPYPTPVEDCAAAVRWVGDNAAMLGIDVDNLSIGGQSAGANLAAAVTFLVREHGPDLRFQLLEVPALDLTGGHLDTLDIDGLGSPEELTAIAALYVPDQVDRARPTASPLLAPDLHGLPPAHVMTAEHDWLRMQGEAYAHRLAEAGVLVSMRRHLGHIHPSPTFTHLYPPAATWRREVLTMLQAHHRPDRLVPHLDNKEGGRG